MLNRKIGKIRFQIETTISDGIFCISQFLIDFYESKGTAKGKLFLVPSTVDPTRFDEPGDRPTPIPYIGYFGSLTFERDNIDILIKAFAQFSQNLKEPMLILGGFCTESEKNKIKDLILKLGIQNRVQVLEYLSRKEITRYIFYSHVLVMVRTDNFETQASFPSKLAEFLATSKPVITVNIGEIPNYLTNGVDAFLIQPGNYEVLAEKLDYVFDNYELAKQVGRRGKELANTVFNYNYQAKRMLGFIDSINN
jgi:glycosyltransferase involved in cell wall biosynthesis